MQELKERYKTIAGDWNGSDDFYVSGGNRYTEFQAQEAKDIVDLIEVIEKEEEFKVQCEKDILADREKLELLISKFNF